MGVGSWSSDKWKDHAHSSSYSTKKTEEIFSSRKIHADLNPHGVKFRESCDSDVNPNSTAVILGLDVTGSMGMIADVIARAGLNTLLTEIYERKPVSDPHVLCMGIGDVEAGDEAPLQATQFEADIRLVDQLEKIWLEKRGGGNSYESYALAWFWAAMHTKIDCFDKRNKKGYLFTIGDELPTPYLKRADIERVTGDTIETDQLSQEDLLTMVSRQWEVFHIIVAEGANCRGMGLDRVQAAWANVIGQRAIPLTDHTKLAEVVVSTLQVWEGVNHEEVAKSWDGSTALVVKEATKGLVPGSASVSSGVVTL